MTIRQKLWLLIASALLMGAFAAGAGLFSLRADLMESRRAKTSSLVDMAYSVLEHYGKQASSGALTQEAAQKAASDIIAALRYDKDNYVSTYDVNYRMVRHPLKPDMNGKDQSEFKDSNGVRIIVELVNAAKRGKGEFVDYLFSSANKPPVPKISTARLYAPWGWVVSSGIYVDDVEAEFRQRAWILFGEISIGLVLLLLIGWRLSNSITGPLQTLRFDMTHIATHGDLTNTRPRARFVGEIADMAAAFFSLIDRFRSIILEVAAGSRTVAQEMVTMAGNAQRIEAQSAAQSRSASDTAVQVDHISTAFSSMSSRIEAVSQLSAQARTLTEEGQQAVTEAVSEMNRIASAVGESAQTVQNLGEQSREISAIVSVIRAIADQTNLLALNAAIEAARAGESGRGFAVVADEVRKLAERTSQSTQTITGMIETIRTGTNQAVTRIQDGRALALNGVELANRAGEVVSRVNERVTEVAAIITEVAHAADDHAQASHKLVGQVESIAQMSNDNAAAVRDMAQTAKRVEDMSAKLDKSVGQFKV